MPSNINRNVPAYGRATTESVRNNFIIAADEISALQAGGGGGPGPGGGIDDVPSVPIGQEWLRMINLWVPYTTVDGGEFTAIPRNNRRR